MNFAEIIVGILSGGGAATLVGAIFKTLINAQINKLTALEQEVARLKTEQLTAITAAIKAYREELKSELAKHEKAFQEHIASDKSQAMATALTILSNKMDKMDAKLDRISEETAKQGAQIVAQGLYISNVDKSLQNKQNLHTGKHHD